MSHRGRRAAVRSLTGALAVAVTIAILTACTSSSSGHGSGGSSSLSSGPTATDSGVPTDSAIPTDPATTTASSPTTSAGSSTIALPKDTCTMSQLGIRIIRGGADAGREIALITFTNTSSKVCSMFGFPGVSLRLAGNLLGQPATRSSVAAHTVHLAPGAQAGAQITDFSSCQAPLSDTVRVYPPNLTAFADKPFDLRACRLQIDPVAPTS